MSYSRKDPDNEPLQFTSTKPKDHTNRPFIDLNTPYAQLTVGEKRSGKGVVNDKILKVLFNAFFTCVSLHSAGGYENLYPIINKNCRQKYDNVAKILKLFTDNQVEVLTRNVIKDLTFFEEKALEKILGLMQISKLIKQEQNTAIITSLGYDFLNGKLLHCKCFQPLPVTWMLPNYIKMEQLTVSHLNGYHYDTYEDYFEAYVRCYENQYMSEEEFEASEKKGQKKPADLIKNIKPILKTVSYTIPINTKSQPDNVDKFRKEIKKFVLDARDEHRILTETPAIFPQTKQGKLEKYSVIAEYINFLPDLIEENFAPLDLD